MDPISIIVTALAAGAAAGLKSNAEKVVADAYEGIKGLIKSKYGRVSVEVIENDPASEDRKRIVQQDLEKTDAAGDQELLRQAQALLEVVEKHAPQAAEEAGIRIHDVRAKAAIIIEDIVTAGHRAVDAENVRAGGEIRIKGIRTGQTGGAPDPQ